LVIALVIDWSLAWALVIPVIGLSQKVLKAPTCLRRWYRAARRKELLMDLRFLLGGRVNAISGRVIVAAAMRKRRKSRAGFGAMSAKLARASEQVRGARHGRQTG
jgi:hypothetical protein